MRSLRICGIDITLDVCDLNAWSPGCMGRCEQLEGRIAIRTGMKKDIEGETLLHEVIHMIADMNGLKIQDIETTVSVLSVGLNAFLRDNDLEYWKK